MASTVCKLLIVTLLIALLISSCTSDKPTDPPDANRDDNLVILRFSSEHFGYYSTRSDAVVIDTVSFLLESNLAEVSALYGFAIDDTIDVKIYPDFETFHANVEWPTDDIPATLVGQCISADEIKFISPLNSEPINSYDEILIVAVHESLHAIHFHVFDISEVTYPPQWLFEGFACFEANQYPNPYIIRQRIIENDLPLIEQFEDGDFFNENYGYHFSYTIFEYLLSEFGYAKVSLLLKYPYLIAYCLGDDVTMETLNADWHQYLIDNYSGSVG